MNTFLFKRIDNSALIVFRIIFGGLCFLESVGAILTGWVKRVFIDTQLTFSFIGFEWLQPLPGYGMYGYYLLMGACAFMVMLGYRYRVFIISFTLLWGGVYFMQKTAYNNHYYLLFLLSFLMIFMPANRYASYDSKHNPKIFRCDMPHWCQVVLVLQLFIVYTYGAIAKLYPDWLNTDVIALFMKGKADYFLIGGLLQEKWLHYILTYGGILFDGLVVPLLLFKSTRRYAFLASICFHLFNSIVFQVGIFPYLALGFSVFFFDPATIRNLFLVRKPLYVDRRIEVPHYRTPLLIVAVTFFVIQIALPLRHLFFKDSVFWTEEGHRLSWRMMLRSRYGEATYTVVNKNTQAKESIDLHQFLTPKQIRSASSKPDIIWQFAQYLKRYYENKGQPVAVFVDAWASVNGAPLKRLINPSVDLASVVWHPFEHSAWILPSK